MEYLDSYARVLTALVNIRRNPPAILMTNVDQNLQMDSLRHRLSEIREEKNTDTRIVKLQRLNSSLPADKQLQVPAYKSHA
jgi:hypothetical protein